jgi:hypothetical protein
MDEQKWSSSSFLLMQALVKNADEAAASEPDLVNQSNYPKGIPYSEARQVMVSFHTTVLPNGCISVYLHHLVPIFRNIYRSNTIAPCPRSNRLGPTSFHNLITKT